MAALYFIEMSKVKLKGVKNMPTLDNLQIDETAKNWDPFYKVRATIIDGQSASFSIPQEIKDNEGKKLQLSGAVVFSGNGCKIINVDSTKIDYFFLLPSLGLAQACEIQPDISMRWTIRVNLKNPWILSRNDMINAKAKATGIFKTDTSKPYEAAFFIENASADLMSEK